MANKLVATLAEWFRMASSRAREHVTWSTCLPSTVSTIRSTARASRENQFSHSRQYIGARQKDPAAHCVPVSYLTHPPTVNISAESSHLRLKLTTGGCLSNTEYTITCLASQRRTGSAMESAAYLGRRWHVRGRAEGVCSARRNSLRTVGTLRCGANTDGTGLPRQPASWAGLGGVGAERHC